jgi:hypothetical protein
MSLRSKPLPKRAEGQRLNRYYVGLRNWIANPERARNPLPGKENQGRFAATVPSRAASPFSRPDTGANVSAGASR